MPLAELIAIPLMLTEAVPDISLASAVQFASLTLVIL